MAAEMDRQPIRSIMARAAAIFGVTGASIIAPDVPANISAEAAKSFSNKGASATRAGEAPKSPFAASVAEAAPLAEPQNAPEADGGIIFGEHVFYNQARGSNPEDTGYILGDDAGVRFLSEFRRFGGVNAVGYPASQRFELDGFKVQVFQRVIFQWRPEVGQVYFVNIFDKFSEMGLDERLLRERQVPLPKKDWNETGMAWGQIVQNRLKVMDAYPAIKSKFFGAVGDPIQANGLPTSDVVDMGNHFALRAQRVVFQQWKEDVPWARKGEVTVALGGDFAKEYGVVPASAQIVERMNVSNPIPNPTPEVINAPFPREIGDLARDGVVIHNKGTRVGVIDNREDPQNNWQAVVDVARRYGGGEKFEFFFYDKAANVPAPSGDVPYDTNINWSAEYLGAEAGKQLRVKSNGAWQWHVNIPSNLRLEDTNKFSRGITLSILRFFISKDDVSTKWGSDFAAILKQQAGDPYNSGKMNFTFRIAR